jgi:hypothetical protein
MKMKNLSGTTNIIFKAKILLKEDKTSTYTLKVPLVIEKNKSSSIAIVPYETRYENGLFIDKFVIHIVDSYGNKAKDGTHIYTGVINNPKIINKNQAGILDKSASTFTVDTNDALDEKNILPTDTLITLASLGEYRPENLGGWDIVDTIPQESKLEIITFDKTQEVDKLNYVIGNEYRLDVCNDTIMNAAASSFESTEVKDGIAYAELRYVPAMVGKTVTIYANARLDDKRIGVSRIQALTGTGLKPVTVTCTNDAGKNPTCRKTITLFQNDSDKFARDAVIGYPINSGDATNAILHITRDNNLIKTDCNGNIDVTITNIDENKTASYTFGVVAREY